MNFKNLDWGILVNRGDCYSMLKDYENSLKVKIFLFIKFKDFKLAK